jgi:hypothetical protein
VTLSSGVSFSVTVTVYGVSQLHPFPTGTLTSTLSVEKDWIMIDLSTTKVSVPLPNVIRTLALVIFLVALEIVAIAWNVSPG